MQEIVDLRSDTVTRPSPGMRRAMAEAEVGDDVFGDDPTVRRLQDHAAALTGKEAALFLPRGTMANLVAFLSQTRPGDAIILSEMAHPVLYEGGNLAMVAGLMTRTVADPLGKMSAEQVAEQIVRTNDPHHSQTTLAALENTTNRGGGAYYQYHEMEEVAQVCRSRGLRLHCDGARLFNACAASNIEPEFYARCCDTVSFCLSKGLGAPAGSMLAGARDTMTRALRFRKMLGGGMRQTGVLAAAGLYALENHVRDLDEDHRRARDFRRALEAEGVGFALPSPTNILYVETNDPARGIEELSTRGVLATAAGTDRIRAVFHRDIDDAGLNRAVEAFKEVLAPRRQSPNEGATGKMTS
jgi:threonine aldolase